MLEVFVFPIDPVVTASVSRSIRVEIFLAVGVLNLLKVFRGEVVTWVICTPFASAPLLLFQSQFLSGRQFKIIFF